MAQDQLTFHLALYRKNHFYTKKDLLHQGFVVKVLVGVCVLGCVCFSSFFSFCFLSFFHLGLKFNHGVSLTRHSQNTPTPTSLHTYTPHKAKLNKFTVGRSRYLLCRSGEAKHFYE